MLFHRLSKGGDETNMHCDDRSDCEDNSRLASTLPAVSGRPHLTVPMGKVAPGGRPVGISFIGAMQVLKKCCIKDLCVNHSSTFIYFQSDELLLQLGYAFEQLQKP